MKRAIIFIGCLLLLMTAQVWGTERIVVAEFITNWGCPPCYNADLALDQLVTQFGDRLAVIRYHWDYPDNTDPFYRYNITENMGRNGYYGNSYSPHLFLDGSVDAGSGYSTWQSRINTELASVAPLDIQINGEFEPSTRNGHVDVRIIGTDNITNTNLKVRISVIESHIHRSAPNGITVHDEVFRDMTPSTSGIALTIAIGDTVDLTQNFSCPTPLVLDNCDIVVFVQSDTGHRILQGAKRSVMSMSYFLTPFTLTTPENNEIVEICSPTFSWHPSVDPDSGYPVRYLAYINFTDDFSSPFVFSDTLSDTTWTSPICVPDNTDYFWKITALNGHAENRDSEQTFMFHVHEPPIGCFYTVGDVNYNGAFNGIDVSYSVSYFKGANPPPFVCECTAGNSWYVGGDVNGNCQFNGIDVSYMVSYFKGGPAPVPCPSCPPVSR
jgi:hypothetical protein